MVRNTMFHGFLSRLLSAEGGSGGGDGPTPPAPPAPSRGASGRDADAFLQDYAKLTREQIDRLTQESARLIAERDAAKAAEAAAAKAADDARKEAEKAANLRVARAELKALAVRHGIVDLDGLQFIDFTKVKIDDNGEVVDAEAIVEKLRTDKPYLFRASTGSPSPTPTPNGGPKSAKDMSPEEWKAFRRQHGLR